MLPFITAEQRNKEFRTAKIILLGPSGIGKTSQLKTLPEDKTLFVDMEAGDLSVQSWGGVSLRPTTWAHFVDIVLMMAGPDPTVSPNHSLSKGAYDKAIVRFGDRSQLDQFDYYFIDSLTELSRLCFDWAQRQPECLVNPDPRATYSLLGRQMIRTLKHLQKNVRNKHVIFTCILDEEKNKGGRDIFSIQTEGSKIAKELASIIDEVISYVLVPENDDIVPNLVRGFVTAKDNKWGYPAKDRSTRLDTVEEPNLFKLIQKCTNKGDLNV